MNTITLQKVNIAAKNLENVTKQAKRRLFEFETIKNLYELQQGNFKKYKSAGDFMKSINV